MTDNVVFENCDIGGSAAYVNNSNSGFFFFFSEYGFGRSEGFQSERFHFQSGFLYTSCNIPDASHLSYNNVKISF